MRERKVEKLWECVSDRETLTMSDHNRVSEMKRETERD